MIKVIYLENNYLFYRTVKDKNETRNKQFIVEVSDIRGGFCVQGQGKNKKEAQQEAARLALIQINKIKL